MEKLYLEQKRWITSKQVGMYQWALCCRKVTVAFDPL